MTVKKAIDFITLELEHIYGLNESKAIAIILTEHVTGISLNKLSVLSENTFAEGEEKKIHIALQRLQQQEPIQYVIEEAWFYYERFHVNSNVLIPRPETEELVDWVIDDIKDKKLTVLDIGTGSGCIAITIKKNCPQAQVTACDISQDALDIAQKNAHQLLAPITLVNIDFLDPATWSQLPCVDVIVCNPPYIPIAQKDVMDGHVTKYEPHLALFVENNNPYQFYKAIADFSIDHLHSKGSIYVEIHIGTHNEIAALFTQYGYETNIKKDMQGIERMIKATKG